MARLFAVLLVGFAVAFGGGDLLAQGMGGGCDPGTTGAGMGCPMPDCPNLQEWMDACSCSDEMDMEECLDSMEEMWAEECQSYSDCPFGEGTPGCDNSWVDQCGD